MKGYEFKLKAEFEEVVGNLIACEGNVNYISKSDICEWIGLQVEIVQERAQKHVEVEFCVVGAFVQGINRKVVVKDRNVRYKSQAEWRLDLH